MKLPVTATVALSLCCLPCVTAQQPAAATPADAKTVRLNRAPVSKEVLRVHLPRPVRRVMPNGLRVLLLEDHRFPRISMQLVLPGAGPFFEPKDRGGVASLTASVLNQGTATRTGKDLAADIERLGASVDVSAGAGSTDARLSANGFSSNFDQWLPLFADILLQPSFPDAEVETAREQELSSLRQLAASSSALALRTFRQALYGEGYPAGRLLPSIACVTSLTRAQIDDWYRQRYVPQNAILVVYGDLTPEPMFRTLSAALAPWQRTAWVPVLPAVPATPKKPGIYLVERPKSVQTNLLIGGLAIDRRSPDYVPLTVANQILGGGTAGRLFIRLREEKGYTYGAYSSINAPEYRGYVVGSSQVRSAVTGPAVGEFLGEFKRMRETPVSDEELSRSERAITAEFALTLESPGTLMSYALTAEKYNFAPDYWDNYAAAVNAVGKPEVQRVAAKYYDPATLQVVAVGDPAIKPMLENLGTVLPVTVVP